MNRGIDMEDPKKLAGSSKPSMHFVPMNVMIGVARVFELGAKKYGLKNWRKQPVAMTTYYSAIHRHLVQFFEVGVDKDNESGQHHLDHVIASCMILRDGIDRKAIIDDRFDYEVKTGEMKDAPAPAHRIPISSPVSELRSPPAKIDTTALINSIEEDVIERKTPTLVRGKN
jgi:hypothetical protein